MWHFIILVGILFCSYQAVRDKKIVGFCNMAGWYQCTGVHYDVLNRCLSNCCY